LAQQPANQPAAPDPSLQQPSPPAVTGTPSIEDLDRYLHQPFRADALHPGIEQVPAGEPKPAPQPGAADPNADLDLLDWLKLEEGGAEFAAKYGNDPDKIRRAILESQRALSRRDQEAAMWRQLQLSQMQAAGQVPAQPQPQPGQPPAAKKLWEAPEWNPEWLSQIGRDEKGNFTGPPDIVRKVQDYSTWAARRQLELMADPEKLLGPLIDARAERIAEQRLQQGLTQYDTKSQAERFIVENQNWMMQGGQLSPLGEVFARTVQHYAARGMSQHDQIEAGKLAVEAAYYKQQAELAQATAAQQQRQVIPPAAPRPNAAAATHAPNSAAPTPQNPLALHKPGEDLYDALTRNLALYGSQPG
jgi:hypothetical protein